jgi:hypothetical protein
MRVSMHCEQCPALQMLLSNKAKVFAYRFRTTVHLTVYHFQDVDSADESIKESSLLLAKSVFEEDSSVRAVRVSYRLPEEPEISEFDIWRDRCCIIPRKILSLSKPQSVQQLTISPDVSRLETAVLKSGLLPVQSKCFMELWPRWMAKVFLFAPRLALHELSDPRARELGIQIAVLLLRSEPSIYEVELAFTFSMRSGGRTISFNREHLRLYEQESVERLDTEVRLHSGRSVLTH